MFRFLFKLVRRGQAASKSARVPFYRPRYEELEGRLAPAVLSVNSILDSTSTGSNILTLREAVGLVNGTLKPTAGELGQISGTLGNNDIIQFNLPAGAQTIALTGGALNVTKAVAINGPGAGSLTISGNNQDRVFIVGHDYSQNLNLVASVSGLTISGGSAVSSGKNYGAGILNFGTLTVSNTTFANNTAGSSGGGGIYNDGALNISNSTFSTNTVTNGGTGAGILNSTSATLTATNCLFSGGNATGGGEGGGIANSGTMTVGNCTFTNNTVGSNGAGIHNSSSGKMTVTNSSFLGGKCVSDGGGYDSDGTSTVINCTFANNTVGSEGGAIDNHGTLSVSNSTFVNNTAVSRGGAINSPGSIQMVNCTATGNRVSSSSGKGGGVLTGVAAKLYNSIVSVNYVGAAPGTTPNDIYGSVDSSSAGNMVGTGGSGGMTNGVNGNQVGVTSLGLGALANNGGPTQTMALLPGSPAIARGRNANVPAGATDERGFARIVNGSVDVGAFELQTTSTPPADQSATQGIAAAVALGSFADANTGASPWSVDVSWGDGSPDTVFTAIGQGSLGSQSHTYSAVGTFTATVTVTDVNKDTSKATFHVGVTAPTGPAVASFGVSDFPTSIQAGTGGAVTVTALDAGGNVVTGYRGTVHFTSSDGQAALPSDYTFGGSDRGTHSFNLTLKTAGSQSVRVTAGALLSGTETGIVVTPAPASTFALTGLPTATTAGAAMPFTVTALDSYGNTATGYGGTVTFTSSDGQADLPDDSTLTNGVGSFGASLLTAGSQTLTATDTATPSLTTQSGAIAVSPAAASTFVLSAPTVATAGSPFTFTVMAIDPFNNTATGYSGNVHFTSNDGQAALPADSTLTAGVGSFRGTFMTPGSQTLTATDTVTPSITATQTGITVNPATASTFGVSGFTSPATAGVAGTFTVTARDGVGNTATGYLGMVHFTSSDPHAQLPADYTFQPGDNGVYTFTATLLTAGSQSLTATDTTAPVTGTQSSIAVNPAGASTFTVAGFPSSIQAGVAGAFTVTARDSFGNTATGYTGTVHFTSSDTQARLPADGTLTNGVGSFSATLLTAGTQSLTATDTATLSITGTQGGIAVQPAPTGLVLTVNSTADNTTADSVLTLREAVAYVDGTLGRSLTTGESAQLSGTGAAIIQFNLPTGPQTITLTAGPLNVTAAVTVNGPGAANLTVSGNNKDRVFIVGHDYSQNLSLVVSISGLTISGGSAVASGKNYGAGILNFGTLTVSNTTFTGNTAGSSGGGGIYNDGALTVTNSTFTANAVTSGGPGGGIQNATPATLTVIGCTFSGNTASSGGSGAGIANSGHLTVTSSTFTGNTANSNAGGIYNSVGGTLTVSGCTIANNTCGSDGSGIDNDGTATVTASTLSGNSAGSEGGGMDSKGSLTLTNCTLYGNVAASDGGGLTTSAAAVVTNCTITANRVTSSSSGVGGGIYDQTVAAQLFNTIVAGNFRGAAPSTTADDIGGTVATASAFNLIGVGGSGGLKNGVNNNQVGIVNVGLGALANNGGPTQTVALLAGSSAIDQGGNAYVTAGETDERGLARLADGTVDIGAFEVQL